MAMVALFVLAMLMPVSQANADDSFYLPPQPIPAGLPGDVVRWRDSQAGPPGARELADAWQVMYISTDGLGSPNVVTGTVLVPKGVDAGSVPIIGLAPGTAGPAFRCAPSKMINKGAYYEQPAINDMLARGYAVAVTDYVGYHPDPATTYIIGRSMGAALLDVVRAAQRLPEAGLSETAPVMLRGYSQGGGAAMWAGQMEAGYAPELDLRGIAAGGVPANLAQVALPLNGQDGFGVLLYALLGQDNLYPELSLEPYLNSQGQQAVAAMVSDMCVLELLQDFQGVSLDEVTDINPLTSQRLQRIAENELGKEAIEVPVYQYHEVQDGLVAYSQAVGLRNQYCSAGVNLTWQAQDTQGANGVIRHINLAYRGNDGVNQFVEQVLAGNVPAPNCSSAP
ncbi:MAG: lipase family protein [Pseudomonadales bacterium]|nr:lipase family protein [Pseudomonadales bacterium]